MVELCVAPAFLGVNREACAPGADALRFSRVGGTAGEFGQKVSPRAEYHSTTFSHDAKYIPVPTKKQPKREDVYEAVFTALAHPARRRILHTLNFEGGAMTAGAIAAIFAHAWPTTTRHLQVLESAGLLVHEQQGRARLYRIERARLRLALEWMEWFFKSPV